MRRFHRAHAALAGMTALLMTLATTACVGDIAQFEQRVEGPSQDGADPNPGATLEADAGADASPSVKEEAVSAGTLPALTAPLRRLSRREYMRTARDLMGRERFSQAEIEALLAMPSDLGDTRGHFDNSHEAMVETATQLTAYQRASELLSQRFIEDLPGRLGCQADRACAEALLDGFARRAWRRRLDEPERQSLLGLFDETAPQYGDAEAIGLMIQALLQSPQFLYRLELDVGPEPSGEEALPEGARALSGEELATRLAFFLWQSTPDEALLDAAERGDLHSEAGLREQAARLLKDERAEEMLSDFTHQWLELERLEGAARDPARFPQFSPQLREAMIEETDRFTRHIVFEAEEGTLKALLGAPLTFVNAELAALYGVPFEQGGEPWQQVELDPTRRAGVLSHPSLLTALAYSEQGSPILRGVFVLDRLMCDELKEPGASTDLTIPLVEAGMTTRERFARQTSRPDCNACHQVINPLGFGFSNFDAIGQWIDTDQDQAVSARGFVSTFVAPQERDFFETFPEMASRLVEDPRVSACFVRQWYEFAQGRELDLERDAAHLAALTARFEERDQDISELLLELVTAPSFRRGVAR